jgi:hypothetical protein
MNIKIVFKNNGDKINVSSLNQKITLLTKNSSINSDEKSSKELYMEITEVMASIQPIHDSVNSDNKIKVKIRKLPANIRIHGIMLDHNTYDIKKFHVLKNGKFFEFTAQKFAE